MFGSEPYDRFGKEYNVSRVLTAQDKFNMTAYEEYSPLYLPAAFAMTYLLAFALSTCVIVHSLLYHGRTLLNGFKRIRIEDDDIHLKLMQNYPEVPDWWYASVFVFFFCLAIVAAEVRSCVTVSPQMRVNEITYPRSGTRACLFGHLFSP
jgi:OPT oligopeptide transporter protein